MTTDRCALCRRPSSSQCTVCGCNLCADCQEERPGHGRIGSIRELKAARFHGGNRKRVAM